MSVKIRSKYLEYVNHKGKTFTLPSRTIQSERDGTFIESYLRKYRLTGLLGDPTRRRMAMYGDFSSLPDFQEAQNRVASTTQFFQSLPSDLRKRFGNDVATFVAYASDPAHKDELINLGVFVRPEGDLNVSQKQQEIPQPSSAQSETPVKEQAS